MSDRKKGDIVMSVNKDVWVCPSQQRFSSIGRHNVCENCSRKTLQRFKYFQNILARREAR